MLAYHELFLATWWNFESEQIDNALDPESRVNYKDVHTLVNPRRELMTMAHTYYSVL